jgi:hypothetical protein
MPNHVVIRGQRAQPYHFDCAQCGIAVISWRTGARNRFCGRPCAQAARRLGNVNRYPQAGHWMLAWNDNGRKRHQWEHRRVWEDAHGPIPKGYIIHHINEDGFDNRLDNLACITKAEHARIHKTLGSFHTNQTRNNRARNLRNLERRIRELERQLAGCTCGAVAVEPAA